MPPNREVAVSRLVLTVAALVTLLLVPGTVSAQRPTSKSAGLVGEGHDQGAENWDSPSIFAA